MSLRIKTKLAATAIVGSLAMISASPLWAQLPAGSAIPRSANERTANELPTPPPVNSDYRKAAEGQLPGAPGVNSPRPLPAGGVVAPATMQPQKPGLDVAMLAEHAVAMAIEGSALQGIADRDPSGSPVNEASKNLLDHARKEMETRKSLMTRAAEDERGLDPSSPIRRFVSASNDYLATLGTLAASPMKPGEKAEVAMINHAVKGVLDADHIQHFGRAYPGSSALEQLMRHAREMRGEGMQTVMKMAGNGPVDATMPPGPRTLAQRGVALLEAADQLNRMSTPSNSATPSGVPQSATNPAPFLNTKPDVIGGTFSNGSQSVGTATGPEAATNVPKTAPRPPGDSKESSSPVSTPPR